MHKARSVRLAGIFLFVAIALPGALHAQRRPTQIVPPQDSMAAQLVDSRKGYVMRLPAEAVLDSGRSGWSPKGLYEQRIYQIKGAGLFQVTVTVRPQVIPDSAVEAGPYRYTTRDSATPGGTARIRTYYLPTRNVEIAIIPAGIRMRPYLTASERIFGTFRWKSGANTDALDTDPPVLDPNHVPQRKESNTLDQ